MREHILKNATTWQGLTTWTPSYMSTPPLWWCLPHAEDPRLNQVCPKSYIWEKLQAVITFILACSCFQKCIMYDLWTQLVNKTHTFKEDILYLTRKWKQICDPDPVLAARPLRQACPKYGLWTSAGLHSNVNRHAGSCRKINMQSPSIF